MKKTFSIVILFLFFANSLYAQNTVQTTAASETALAPAKGPWGFKIDLNFFRFDGSYGFGVTYDLMEKLSSELSYTHTNYFIDDFSGGLRSFDTTANAYGLRLNYYPFSDVKSGGFYASGTVSSVSLNTEISAEPIAAPSIHRDLDDQHIGRQVILGYHFIPNIKKEGIKNSSRIGVGYGNGNSYGIREGWKEYEIADTAFLDASVILFY